MTPFPLTPEHSDDPLVGEEFAKLKLRWGAVLHLYRLLAWAPKLMKAWGAYAWVLRFEVDVPHRLRELLIIQIGWLLQASYEYEHHLPMARDAGVTQAQIDALPAWEVEPSLFDEVERAILQLGKELAFGRAASPETMKTLRAELGEQKTVELIVTAAFYCGVARVINSTGLALELGYEHQRPRQA